MKQGPCNPLDKKNLGQSVANALPAKEFSPLGKAERCLSLTVILTGGNCGIDSFPIPYSVPFPNNIG